MTDEHLEKINDALRMRCASCEARLLLHYLKGYIETTITLKDTSTCMEHMLKKIETIIGKD